MEKAIAEHFACASRPKRPRTKDDDEDNWNMTFNRYRYLFSALRRGSRPARRLERMIKWVDVAREFDA